MTSLSDVRVQLLASELEADQCSKVFDVPPTVSRWALMVHRWRTRRVLLQLDPDELRDIGLTCEQARHEGCKPFWR